MYYVTIGNHRKHANMGCKHSRDATKYKIILTKKNSQFPALPVSEKRLFFHGNQKTSAWPWYISVLKDEKETIGLQGLQYF